MNNATYSKSWSDREIEKISKILDVERLGQTLGKNILYKCTNKNKTDKGVLYLLKHTNFEKIELVNVYDGSKSVRFNENSISSYQVAESNYIGGICDSILACLITGISLDKKVEFYTGNLTGVGNGLFMMDDLCISFTTSGKIELDLPMFDKTIEGQIKEFPMKSDVKVDWRIVK